MKLALLALLLSGCASGFSGLCAVKPIGQSEQGIAFVKIQCESDK